MTNQDTTDIKAKIVQTIKTKGACLPVHIAKEINMSMLFTSAFLSELTSEQKIKMSDMRVGSSPIYFLQGQESQIEKYGIHLKSKEKDAFQLLKEKKFLEDQTQLPAIRVALRSIKDFAIPFRSNEKIFWRYYTAKQDEFTQKNIQPPQNTQSKTSNENEFQNKIKNNETHEQKDIEKTKKLAPEIPESILKETQKIETPETKIQTPPKNNELNIFDKKQTKSKPRKKQTKSNKNEKFFNAVKEFLNKKSFEIISIEGMSKSDLTLKIKANDSEQLLIAFDKKRITEVDIIKAHKKAKEQTIPYTIFCKGEPAKKMQNLIEAIKDLTKIERIE